MGGRFSCCGKSAAVDTGQPVRRQPHNRRSDRCAELVDDLRREAQSFGPVKKPSSSLVWLGVLSAAVLLAGTTPGAAADGKKEPLPEAPPPARPLIVKVPRGETIEIQMRTFGSRTEPLRYLIRTPPEHGRLTEPRRVNREVSAVTYTPPANAAVVRDRFSYAVQTSAGVSAAAEVAITIVDPVPELALPAGLDFSSVLVGTITTKALEITNRGGGVAEGRVTLDAPWKIEGPTQYRLAAGARAVFKVVFAPETAGDFATLLRVTSQPDASVTIHGEARAAIAVSPARIVLQPGATDPARSASFSLTNQTDGERPVALSAGPRLQVPPDLTIPAHGSVIVPVLTTGGDLADLEDEVRVESAGFAVRVPVQAKAVGAIVRSLRERVAFGRVDATHSAEAKLELENIGGAVANVDVEIAAPFTTEAKARLEPGEKKSVNVHLSPGAPGKYLAKLTLNFSGRKLELPVEAELVAAAGPAPSREAVAMPISAPARSSSEPPAQPPPGAPPAGARRGSAEVRVVEGVQVSALGPTGATLEWPVALSSAEKFRVESLALAMGADGNLEKSWVELPGVVFRQEGEKYFAVLKNLRPATGYSLRLVPLSPDSEASQPLFNQILNTQHAKPSPWPKFTVLRGLIAALFVFAFLKLRQFLANRRNP